MKYLKLPIEYPLVDSLPQHSYLLATLHDDSMPFILNHFIQLFMPRMENESSSKEQIMINYCHSLFGPFIDNGSLIINNRILSYYQDEIQFLINCLQSHYYIFLHLDWRYCPYSDFYNKKHWVHGALIYGYNEIEKKFYLLDYVKGKLSYLQISFEDLMKAIRSDIDGMRQSVSYASDMSLVKSITKKIELDIYKINGTLYDYISGIDRFHRKFSPQKHVFGVNVYDQINRGLQRVIDNEDIYVPRKMFYLLLEHKKIMELRLQYLSNYLKISICDDYSQIRKKAEVCLNLYLKYEVTNNKKLINTIIQHIEEMKKMEFRVLPEVIHKLAKFE